MYCQRFLRLISQHKISGRVFSQLYEPDYLDGLKPKIPIYGTINIQIKGYDFRVLENYQRCIHTLAQNMDIEVEESWAVPMQSLQIQKFKENTTVVETEYTLDVYERNVQIVDVPSTTYPVFLRALEATLPEGITLQALEHMQQYEEIRYVPDQELKELKTQLDEIGGVKKTK